RISLSSSHFLPPPLPPPPRPTLFPYTTLFRSKPPYLPRNGPFQTVRELLMVRGVSRELLFADDAKQNGLLQSPWTQEETAVRPADRKSTRLNSSHDQISYAVFCLKKKKKKEKT